ncbi:hypothetical protein ACFO0S_08160 [Chryseomicrobium palamuruense]|uniref:MFS transporter n=1 Tax=Chryseomicrobium palamuruense TaxID=682973 RepID=A0ABV8UX61_9BACL
MLNRKLEAAVLTLPIGYFIVPFFFPDWLQSYFIIGAIVTMYAAPYLFFMGLPVSWWIQKRTNHILIALGLHGMAGAIGGALAGWIFNEVPNSLLFIVIGLVYSLIYFGVDWLLGSTRFYKREVNGGNV